MNITPMPHRLGIIHLISVIGALKEKKSFASYDFISSLCMRTLQFKKQHKKRQIKLAPYIIFYQKASEYLKLCYLGKNIDANWDT